MSGSAVDGVILGAGHNSLVLQAYLARAGLDVVCLERHRVIGGGLVTEEWPEGSGFFHNTHSFFHRGITRMPWYRDLELDDRGARYRHSDVNVSMVSVNGESVEWWIDPEKTIESFAAIDAKDALTLRRWRDAFVPIVESILEGEACRPPAPPADRDRRLRSTPGGRLLLKTSEASPLEFVRREFRNPFLQAALLFANGLREIDLTCRGFGHFIPALFASRSVAEMCLGGSARLADALVAAIREAGGRILTEAAPSRVTRDGSAGFLVETESGEAIRARRFVASGLNPQQTFLDLMNPDDVPSALRDMAENYRYNLVAPLVAVNVNLSEPPAYAAVRANEALMVVCGLRDANQYGGILQSHRDGTLPAPLFWGACPTRFDPGQAPPGGHTAFIWEKAPFRLAGDPASWDTAKSSRGRELLEAWNRFAPNLADSTLDWRVSSPLDTERRLPNMRGGDLLVGSLAHGQTGYHRPFPGAGEYRTPIPGLYLCGSCCHPGGNITGLPGYNAAQVILADLGIDAPPLQVSTADGPSRPL